MPPLPPRYLFKYESLSVQALRNLKTQTLFFGSPRRFNDPYDCALLPRAKVPSPEQLARFRSEYRSDGSMPLPAREALQGLGDSELAKLLLNAGQSALKEATEQFLSSRGVTCFSETNDNLLMWSHYGDRARGMCLEFDTRYEPFTKVMPVEYVAEVPIIDVVADMLRGAYDDIMRLYCTKSIHWAYEREWRGIHSTKDTAFHYESPCLSGVYFGPDCSEDLIEIACLILAGQNETVRTYRGSRSSDTFSVVFAEFQYHSNLDAKKKGLR